MSARRLFESLFVLSLFTMAIRETLDPDLWWHLRTGDLILREGIPNQDPFSFTVIGQKWVTHEWLSELILWLAYQPFELIGLSILFAGIIAAAFWLVFLRCDGRPYLAAFVVILAAVASAPLWGVRPQMFNLLFTAIFIFLVEGYKDKKVNKRLLWLLPILTIVWANLHSGYLFGIVILALYVIGEAGQVFLGIPSKRGLSGSEIGRLALITLLSFLLAVINPNGPELWIYPFLTLGSSAMQQYIQEWQSANFHSPLFWPFAILLFLGVIGFVTSRVRPSLTDALLFMTTAAAALLSVRHIPLFAVVASPIIARYLVNTLEGTRLRKLVGEEPPLVETSINLKIVNWSILALVALVAIGWIANIAAGNDDAIAERYPVEAVDYLEQSGLAQSNGYNSYGWGGYLIWRGLPVFVDGRADVYGDDFLQYYRQTFDVTRRWQEPLNRFAVDYVLTEQGSPLSSVLAASDSWKVSYDDAVSTVYTRVKDE